MVSTAVKIPEIDRIEIRPFPTRTTNLKVVRVGECTFGFGKSETVVYSTGAFARRHATYIGCFPWWVVPLANALVKAGRAPEDLLDRVADANRRHNDKLAARDIQEDLERLERHGLIKTKPSLKAKLVKITGRKWREPKKRGTLEELLAQ